MHTIANVNIKNHSSSAIRKAFLGTELEILRVLFIAFVYSAYFIATFLVPSICLMKDVMVVHHHENFCLLFICR